MIDLKGDCTGCGACASVCAQSAIAMTSNEGGFIRPTVDYSKCFSCGICRSVCPVLNSPEHCSTERACFAAWNTKENIRYESTSGGAFSAIAEHVISNGGSVFGAAYDAKLAVRHIEVRDVESLKSIRGVKYVQSEIEANIYKKIEENLRNDVSVLFVGTPCQAAAVRSLFGYDKNLIIADLICFGVPSRSLWAKYVGWMEDKLGSKICYISPRDKKKGWGRKTFYRFDCSDGCVIRECSIHSPYAQAFYSTLAFRESCFDCKFRGVDRASDLTLFDLWGAEKIEGLSTELKKGVSGVVCHTLRGIYLLRSCGLNLMPIDCGLVENENFPLTVSPTKPACWSQFQMDVENLEFEELIRRYGLKISKTDVAVQKVKDFCGSLMRRVMLIINGRRVCR